MRFELAALVTALVGMCTADTMSVYTSCNNWDHRCDSSGGIFITAFGSYKVDASEGCRGTPVPGMVEFCVDWGNARGHFRFDHQSFRRCMRKISDEKVLNCSDVHTCYISTWDEVGCTWRQAPLPIENTVSSAALPEPTTLVTVPKNGMSTAA